MYAKVHFFYKSFIFSTIFRQKLFKIVKHIHFVQTNLCFFKVSFCPVMCSAPRSSSFGLRVHVLQIFAVSYFFEKGLFPPHKFSIAYKFSHSGERDCSRGLASERGLGDGRTGSAGG